ncbi:MAG: HPr family phosphocarrier protein [Selenomonadales bacterium]|nr:HPr family phosphocarrier protein [Selenomonadales bacterium]
MKEAERSAVISNEVLHFRPFARLRELCGKLNVDVRLSHGDDTLSAANILALTGWELTAGDRVLVTVRGSGDVQAALDAIIQFIEEGFGERQ